MKILKVCCIRSKVRAGARQGPRGARRKTPLAGPPAERWGVAGGETNERKPGCGSEKLEGLVRGAVSKPMFASKYACESSRRDLHNTHLCTDLRP